MDSLSKPEKGWQTKGNLATGTSKAKRERANGRKTSKSKGVVQIDKSFPEVPPKSPMTFERDWRRHCSTRQLKLQYLRLCGPDTLRKVFKTELDVALMGQLIQVFADAARSFKVAGSGGAEDTPSGSEGGADLNPPTSELVTALEIFSYMCIFPTTGRFPLNIEFLGDTDRANVGACLEWLSSVGESVGGDTGAGGDADAAITPEAIGHLRAKFKCD